MRGGGNLSDARQHFDVRRGVVEIVIAHQAAVRLATGHAEFFFVQLLEERTLVPGGAFVFLERLGHLLLGDVHDADFQVLTRLGVVDQVMQTAPGAFEALEVLMMEDEIDLLGELAIDLGDDGLDGLDRIVRNQRRGRQAPARPASAPPV